MARPGLERNRKFVMLRSALGSRLLAIGALELIWATCYESGDPRLGTPEMVEAIAGWSEAGQEPGKLFRALKDCGGEGSLGFIEPDPSNRGRWQVHDLIDHAPDYDRKSAKREQERSPDRSVTGQCPVSDRSLTAMSGQPSGNGGTPAPAPAPAPNQETTAEAKAKPKSPPKASVAEKRDGFADHAYRSWEALHKTKPPWTKADYAALAQVTTLIGENGNARAAWDRYLTVSETFFAGHPPRKFLREISRFVAQDPKGADLIRFGAYRDKANDRLKPNPEADAFAKRRWEIVDEEKASGKHATEAELLTAVTRRMMAERGERKWHA